MEEVLELRREIGSRMVWRRDCLNRFGAGGPTTAAGTMLQSCAISLFCSMLRSHAVTYDHVTSNHAQTMRSAGLLEHVTTHYK